MIMADSLSTATLLPLAAMRVNRPAEPLICVDMVEKVSVCVEALALGSCAPLAGPDPDPDTHRRVNHVLGARVVVDVDRHPAQRRHFRRQLVEAGIVLPFALVGLGHGACRGVGAEALSSGVRGAVVMGWTARSTIPRRGEAPKDYVTRKEEEIGR